MQDPQILVVETPTAEDLLAGGGQFQQFVAPFIPPEWVVQVDLARLPIARAGISFEQDENDSRVFYGSQKLSPTAAYLSLGVGWVFDRALEEALAAQKLRADQLDTARRAVDAHSKALLAEFPDIPWMNSYESIQSTGHRPRTLRDAQLCGLTVARAIQTIDPNRARRFVERELALGGCVYKSPIKMVWTPRRRFWWSRKPQPMWLSTRRVRRGAEPVYDYLSVGPLIFQQYVPGRRIRVNVIMCPPAPEVRAAEAIMPRDWELQSDICDHRIVGHTYAPFELPVDLADRCIELLKLKHLRRAELDFNLTSEGQFVLVDVNEDGRWGFLEEELGYPIGQAVSRMLLSEPRRRPVK